MGLRDFDALPPFAILEIRYVVASEREEEEVEEGRK